MDNRIRVPEDKADIIDRLLRSDSNPKGVFRLKAEVIVFAAAFGYRHNKSMAFTSSSEPIRIEVFERNGLDRIIPLLTIAETRDPHSLSDGDEATSRKVKLFEEYANGGLELLRNELHGIDDPLDRLLLLLQAERGKGEHTEDEEFDLTRFL
jgi:dnd system-associated protein 4